MFYCLNWYYLCEIIICICWKVWTVWTACTSLDTAWTVWTVSTNLSSLWPVSRPPPCWSSWSYYNCCPDYSSLANSTLSLLMFQQPLPQTRQIQSTFPHMVYLHGFWRSHRWCLSTLCPSTLFASGQNAHSIQDQESSAKGACLSPVRYVKSANNLGEAWANLL